jgi:hypothetical protein
VPPASRTFMQYRLTWKREGLNPKHKKYHSMKRVERMIHLLGPEPWKALGHDPEARCCSGLECGCGGRTYRENMLEARKDLPPIEYIKVERRIVTTTRWQPNE